MFIHILTSENAYHINLIQFIERNFSIQEHGFIFRSKRFTRSKYKETTSIESCPNYISLLRSIPQLIRAQKIYIHYLPYGPSLPFWTVYSLFSSKLVWVYWGGDIYAFKEKNRNIKSRFYELCRRIIIKNLKNISGFLYEDFEVIKKVYHTKASYTKIIYPLPVDFLMLEKALIESQPTKNTVKTILAGNSADPSNNHIELFKSLEGFKDENIEIICPLSYGPDKDYTSLVIKEGQRIFGDKFKPLTQFLNTSEYSKILLQVDVAIMNHKRQQGLGNLSSILWLGKKVFVRSDTTSYNYFKSEGITVFDTLNIKNLSFESLIAINPDDAIKNKTVVLNVFSEKHYIELWSNLFSQQ